MFFSASVAPCASSLFLYSSVALNGFSDFTRTVTTYPGLISFVYVEPSCKASCPVEVVVVPLQFATSAKSIQLAWLSNSSWDNSLVNPGFVTLGVAVASSTSEPTGAVAAGASPASRLVRVRGACSSEVVVVSSEVASAFSVVSSAFVSVAL